MWRLQRRRLWLGQEAQAGHFGRQEGVQDKDQGFGAGVQLQGLWRRERQSSPAISKTSIDPFIPHKTKVMAQV